MPANQCMGCQAGWPFAERHLKNPGLGALHRVPGYPGEVVTCTKDRYEAPALPHPAAAMAPSADDMGTAVQGGGPAARTGAPGGTGGAG